MKRIKTVKKSIVSLILVCAMFVSVFAVSTVSVSAASSPQLNLVNPNASNHSFDVVWNKVPGAVRYRLYFGTYNKYNNGWRRYTNLSYSDYTKHPYYSSFQLTINSSLLRGRTWYPYGDDKGISTPYLRFDECYKCQVEAFDVNNEHIAWTNVSYVYLGAINAISSIYDRASDTVNFRWSDSFMGNSKGINKFGCQYITIYNGNNNNYKIDYLIPELASRGRIQMPLGNVKSITVKVRACVVVNNKIIAYGPWSSGITLSKTYM